MSPLPLVASVTERRLGIELEVAVPIVGRGETRDVQALLADILTHEGIPAIARPYSHEPLPEGRQVAVEHDCSLRGEAIYQGIQWAQIEIKTRPLTYREAEQLLPPVLEIVNYLGARITKSCGFHVHHDFPEVVEQPWVLRNLMHLWWRYHPVSYGLVAPSRRDNSYCRTPTSDEATRFDKCKTYEQVCKCLAQCDRHSGLNVTNLARGGRMTVEWRVHAGTTDWQKVSAWLLATQRWVEHAVARSCQFHQQPITNTRAGLNSLLIVTGLKPNSRIYSKVDREIRQAGRYLLKRWKHFNQETGDDQDDDQ